MRGTLCSICDRRQGRFGTQISQITTDEEAMLVCIPSGNASQMAIVIQVGI